MQFAELFNWLVRRGVSRSTTESRKVAAALVLNHVCSIQHFDLLGSSIFRLCARSAWTDMGGFLLSIPYDFQSLLSASTCPNANT
jgi:hypothetical protein